MVQILAIRKLADTSTGERVKRFDPVTGVAHLVNPATGEPEPWPLAGVQIEGDTPTQCRVPTGFVSRGLEEGWLELEGARPAHRPGGPASNPWKSTHTFIHADTLIIKTATGDVRYTITRQPDKYVDSDDDQLQVTPEIYADGATRVDWVYDLQLEGSDG